MIAFLTVVPLGKEALSKDVAKVIDVIDKSGIEYRLTAMGTVLEGEPDDVWRVLRTCHETMRKFERRVHTHISIDDRQDEVDAINSKVDDIEKHLGRDLRT